MAFEHIREKIKEKLESIDSIQEVYDYPTEEFTGFPAAVVKSTRLEAEFQTTIENKRTYVFTVFLIQEIQSQGVKKARRIIEGVVDDVIDNFDKDQRLSGISMPSGEEVIICYPVLSEIVDNPKYVTAELEIKVVVSFSTE